MHEPRRIVSLLSSATEILYGLGLEDRVVAVSHECDYPPAVAHKPRVTKSHVLCGASSRAIDDQVRALAETHQPLYELDVARLESLRPELIITQSQCDVCAVRYDDVLAATRDSEGLRGVPVIALNPSSLGEVLDDVLRIGEATGALSAAQKFAGDLRRRIDRVRELNSKLTPQDRPRTCCIEWLDPPMLAGNWMPEMIAWAGGTTSVPEDGTHSGYCSWEAICDYRPQVVILMPCGFDLNRTLLEVESLREHPGWIALMRGRPRAIFAVDGNAYFNRSGPRLVDSLEILAHLLHPICFGPPSLVDSHTAWRRLA